MKKKDPEVSFRFNDFEPPQLLKEMTSSEAFRCVQAWLLEKPAVWAEADAASLAAALMAQRPPARAREDALLQAERLHHRLRIAGRWGEPSSLTARRPWGPGSALLWATTSSAPPSSGKRTAICSAEAASVTPSLPARRPSTCAMV